MIELNLVPDVKREFIRAQKMRALVISISIITTIIAVGVVILLAIIVFGWQTFDHNRANGRIEEERQKLASVQDVEKILTLQNQVAQIDASHTNKSITSRVFNVLTATNPASPNDIRYSTVSIDTAEKTLTIEAQTLGGYRALETYNKTLVATLLSYKETGSDSRAEPVPLATDIAFENVGYGRNSQGQRVLSFTVKFTYAEELFAPSSEDAKLGGEECAGENTETYDCTNVTDSYVSIPRTMFENKAESEETK